MENFILALLLSISGIAYGSANNFQPASNTSFTEKTEIQISDLPQPVIQTLEGAKFTGWKPVIVYKVQEESTKYYEVTFVRGDEVVNLKLNEDGGKIG